LISFFYANYNGNGVIIVTDIYVLMAKFNKKYLYYYKLLTFS